MRLYRILRGLVAVVVGFSRTWNDREVRTRGACGETYYYSHYISVGRRCDKWFSPPLSTAYTEWIGKRRTLTWVYGASTVILGLFIGAICPAMAGTRVILLLLDGPWVGHLTCLILRCPNPRPPGVAWCIQAYHRVPLPPGSGAAGMGDNSSKPSKTCPQLRPRGGPEEPTLRQPV